MVLCAVLYYVFYICCSEFAEVALETFIYNKEAGIIEHNHIRSHALKRTRPAIMFDSIRFKVIHFARFKVIGV
jgi:hypothetical protein